MIYADNAATTALNPKALDAMLPYMTQWFGNPSSIHDMGQKASQAMTSARQTIARCLSCSPRELTFTSGGTEADNQAILSAASFINADKPDSQDICFVPNGDYAAVIEHHTGKKAAPGNFLTPDGKVLGKHQGIIHYTIGQRRGLGLTYHKPLYVCKICPRDNTVILGQKSDLMYGVLSGNSQIVKLLLDAGADPNAKDAKEKTVLDYLERAKRFIDQQEIDKITALLKPKSE